MSGEALVSAAEVARLAGVGRAAVSNWRRRYADFPAPVDTGGSASAFRLDEVQEWLRGQGKLRTADPTDVLWRVLEAGDRALLEVVADLATELRDPGSITLDPEIRNGLDQLGNLVQESSDDLIELLCSRLFERQQRQHLVTPEPLAALMAELASGVGLTGGTVFNPACGPGNLMLAARAQGAGELIGQESDPALARLARARTGAHIVEGDALRSDAFPELRADVVFCDPPFGYRDWGHEELAVDPRWDYGFPVKGEPELAWVQHCLAHARAGGIVVMLLPAGVATRRSGRTIRQALVRRGAVRAVIALPPGVLMSTGIAIHLWVLRNPENDDNEPVLLVDAGRHQPQRRGQVDWDALRDDVLDAWEEFGSTGTIEEIPGERKAIVPIELLHEEVDLAPPRHLTPPVRALDVNALERARTGLVATLGELVGLVPRVEASEVEPRTMTTVNELARAGAVQIRRQSGRLELEEGDNVPGPPVLAGRDVLAGTGPTARLLNAAAGRTTRTTLTTLTRLEPGDLVVPLVVAEDGRPIARVITERGWVLGPNLGLLRVDGAVLDVHFLAGQIRAGGGSAASSTSSGAHRFDVRRVELPVLDLDEQRRLGEAFRALESFETKLRQAAEVGRLLSGQVTDGLAAGVVSPVVPPSK